MKVFPTGKDAVLYKQLIIGSVMIGVGKVLNDLYPTASFIFGFLCIVGGVIYLLRKVFGKKKTVLQKDNQTSLK